MPVSKRLRYEVMRRDGHTCRYCGATAPEAKLTIDHVVPRALGGSDKDPANLVTACSDCNGDKTSSSPDAPLVVAVAEDAVRWSRAMSAAAGEMLARASEDIDAHEYFAKVWARYGSGPDRKPLPKDPGWRKTVENLLSAGLPMAVLEECIEVAMSQRRVAEDNVFRYMCGVAWRKVGELQKAAREKLEDEPAPDDSGPKTPDEYAVHLLGQLSDAERARAYKDVDDVAGDDEPATSDEGRASSALWFALNNLLMDREHLSVSLEKLLRQFPDGEGVCALDEAHKSLQERFGPGFSPYVAAANAAYDLTEALSEREAAAYLSILPAAEQEAWLARARDEWRDADFGFTDAFYVSEAARLAREAV